MWHTIDKTEELKSNWMYGLMRKGEHDIFDLLNISYKNNMTNDIIAEKLVKDYSNNNLRAAMYLIVKYCLDEVGVNRLGIIEKIKNMNEDKELEKLINISPINKNMLKPFLLLNHASRKDALDELIENIKKYSSRIERESERTEKHSGKNIYKTKIVEISFKLSSKYKQLANSEVDFYAKYDDDLEFAAYIDRWSIFDEKNQDQIAADCVSNGIAYIRHIAPDAIQIGEQNASYQKNFGVGDFGLRRYVTQKALNLVYEGNQKKFKISCIMLSGEGFYNKKFEVVIIQSCSVKNYEKYEKIIDENIMSCIEHKADNQEKYVRIEDKDLGKVVFVVDEDNYKLGMKECSFDLKEFGDTSIEFDYKDDGIKSLDELMKYMNEYLRSFKRLLKFKGKILNALYKEAKEIYGYGWLEEWYSYEEITDEFVKKHTCVTSIEITRNSAKLSGGFYDEIEDEDRDLGGHGFELMISDKQFKNNCDELYWAFCG